MSATYYERSPMASIRMLVGVWRHEPSMCRPGFYRVIPCADSQWGMPHCDAVVDDFGDLVMVKQ
jgi:hypothetical protein